MTDFKRALTELCTEKSKDVEVKALSALYAVLDKISSRTKPDSDYSGQQVSNPLDFDFVDRMENLEYLNSEGEQ